MRRLNDEDADEVATKCDLHRLGWEYMCDKSKYPLSENDIEENRLAWELRRTAIRKSGMGATAQYDKHNCFMCDKRNVWKEVECYNCLLTYCEDCFGEGMDGCVECNDIIDDDSEDEDEDDDCIDIWGIIDINSEDESEEESDDEQEEQLIYKGRLYE